MQFLQDCPWNVNYRMLRRVIAVIGASMNTFVFPEDVVGWDMDHIGAIIDTKVNNCLNLRIDFWTK